jgi:hypothetical protein
MSSSKEEMQLPDKLAYDAASRAPTRNHPDDFPPPPPYDFVQGKNPAQAIQAPPEQLQYPGADRSPHFLHIYLDDGGLTHRHMSIVGDDKTTKLYTVKSNWGTMLSSKPHMRIMRASVDANNSPEIGTVTFHSLSSTELELHGRPVVLERPKLLSRTRTFQSATDGKLTWQYESVGSTATLRNERNEWLARFDRASLSLSKHGKLELSSPAISRELLEEIIVTGLAVIQEARRREDNAS